LLAFYKSARKSTLLAAALGFAATAQAQVAIDSFTSSLDGTDEKWGILESITVGSTTYSSLNSGTLSNVSVADLIAIDGFAADGAASIGGNNLDTGTLNGTFTVQFGQTVTTSDLFYFIDINSGDDSNGSNDISVQAIDSSGGNVGSAFAIDNISLLSGNPDPTIGGRTWLRDSGNPDLTDRGTSTTHTPLLLRKEGSSKTSASFLTRR